MRHSKKKIQKTIRDIIFYSVLAVVLILFLFPIGYAFLTSFKPPVLAESPIPYIIFKPTLNNYRTLFVEEDYERFFINSIVISVVTVAVSLLANYRKPARLDNQEGPQD